MKHNLFAMVFPVAAAFALTACVQGRVDGREVAEESGGSEPENVGAAESALATRTGFSCAAGYSLLLESNFLTCKRTFAVNSPTPVRTDVTRASCSIGGDLPKPKAGTIDDCTYINGGTSICPTVHCPAGVNNCAQSVYVIDGYASSPGADSCETDVYYTMTTDYQQPFLK